MCSISLPWNLQSQMRLDGSITHSKERAHIKQSTFAQFLTSPPLRNQYNHGPDPFLVTSSRDEGAQLGSAAKKKGILNQERLRLNKIGPYDIF